MNTVNLIKLPHDKKVGMTCEDLPANIFEDTLFVLDGKPVGFYLRQMPQDMLDIAEFCNKELMSGNVKKTLMNRSTAIASFYDSEKLGVSQYSVIL